MINFSLSFCISNVINFRKQNNVIEKNNFCYSISKLQYYFSNSIFSSKAYRIKALRDFANVKIGDLGGFLQSETNLSHDGNAWIYDNAMVYDKARVYDNAKIFNDANVHGSA